jgi:hypothetical protein
VKLDLLVERQLLLHAVHPATLHIGPAEPEAQAQQRVQDPLLSRQRVHGHRVQVALVHRAGHLELGGQAHGHAVQVLPVHLGDRGLPRHVEAERDVVPGTRIEPERAGQALPVELLVGVVLAVAALHLDPGDQADRHVFDVGGMVAAHHLHGAFQVPARPAVGVGEHRFHGRAPDAHRLHHPFEDHVGFPFSEVLTRRLSSIGQPHFPDITGSSPQGSP